MKAVEAHLTYFFAAAFAFWNHFAWFVAASAATGKKAPTSPQ
jgi:hypothetical protein